MALLLLGSLFVALALVLVLDALLKPAEARKASFKRVAAYADLNEVGPTIQVERPRLTPRGHLDELQLRIEAAGLSGRLDADRFLALKTVLAVFGVVIGFVVGGVSVGGFFLAVILAAACLLGPDFLLARAANARAERLSVHLPQVIDQIAI